MQNLIFFLILLSSISLSAQTKKAKPKPSTPAKVADPVNDPEAEKYLKTLKSKVETMTSFRMTYKLSITDADGKITSQNGTYLGSKAKFISETNQTKTINDGTTQWVIDSKNKEIQIAKVAVSKGKKIESPIDVIKRYQSLFKYRVKEPLSNGVVVLELIPLDKNSPYFKVDISIQVKSNQLINTKLYDRGGNRLLFTISKNEENLKLAENTFTCNLESYKDYEVMDMR